MKASDAELERTLETIERLGPWFQNVQLPIGASTAPEHPLGDWPRRMWNSLKDELPADLEGKTVLDIGCNAGFYAFELAMRGAEVMGVDPNPRYLRQARWLRKKLGLQSRVRFRQSQVYNLAQYDRQFDIVLMMGVFYHLRYPLLGLDIAVDKAKETLVFQSLMTPTPAVSARSREPVSLDSIEDLSPLAEPTWPQMAFIEESLAGDPSNWWVPNAPGVNALLRSAGLKVRRRVAGQVFICDVEHEASAAHTWDRAELLAATGRSWRHAAPESFSPREGTLEMMALR